MIGIANGVAIPFLNVIYKKVGVALTEWELHRTFNEFNEALALKLFMFQFVNSYASLFFLLLLLAFLSPTSVSIVLCYVCWPGGSKLVELGMPALMRRLKSLGSNATATSSLPNIASPSQKSTPAQLFRKSLWRRSTMTLP